MAKYNEFNEDAEDDACERCCDAVEEARRSQGGAGDSDEEFQTSGLLHGTKARNMADPSGEDWLVPREDVGGMGSPWESRRRND